MDAHGARHGREFLRTGRDELPRDGRVAGRGEQGHASDRGPAPLGADPEGRQHLADPSRPEPTLGYANPLRGEASDGLLRAAVHVRARLSGVRAHPARRYLVDRGSGSRESAAAVRDVPRSTPRAACGLLRNRDDLSESVQEGGRMMAEKVLVRPTSDPMVRSTPDPDTRVSTGIPGLDELLEGGFPTGSLITLAGRPWTWKGTFEPQFLYQGARESGGTGMYVSMLEGRKAYFRNMNRLGLDLLPLEKKDLFRFLEMPTLSAEGLPAIREGIVRHIDQAGSARLVIDSFLP